MPYYTRLPLVKLAAGEERGKEPRGGYFALDSPKNKDREL